MHLSDPLDRIVEDRRERARCALAATFGRSPVAALEPLTAGASAASYRIEVGGRAYLLRLESFERDEVRDPHRSYRCMQAAVEAGVAPALRHADAAAGVAIMDFVPPRALSDHPGGPQGLALALGELVARLQAAPVFPPVASYFAVLERLLDRLVASGLFAPGLLEPHVEGLARIRAAYPWDASRLVSSHNDPHPANVLFDGERLWLIDWETAYRNDPLVDVAILTMHLAPSAELEAALLRSWLGREPDRGIRARLVLMRQLALVFYGCASSLYASGMPGIEPETDLVALTPAEFRAAITEGRLVLGAPRTQLIGGKVALARFVEGLASATVAQALADARA